MNTIELNTRKNAYCLFVLIFFAISSSLYSQQTKKPTLYLTPFGGYCVSFSYQKYPPTNHFLKMNSVGGYYGCWLEYRLNLRLAIVTGYNESWNATKYNVSLIIKSSTGSYDAEFPILFCYYFKKNRNIFLMPFIQAGASYNIRNKNDWNGKIRWSSPYGTATDFWINHTSNDFSFKIGAGINKIFFKTGSFTVSLIYNIGTHENLENGVIYKYYNDSLWYSDLIATKGDYFAMYIGYTFPLLKKYFFKLSNEPETYPVRKRKKPKFPEKTYLPRVFIEPFGGFSFPACYLKSKPELIQIKTKMPIGGYFGFNTEYHFTKDISIILGYNRNFQNIKYNLYYPDGEKMLYDEDGKYLSEIPLLIRFYTNNERNSCVFIQLGICYNIINDDDYWGKQSHTEPDTCRNFNLYYIRNTNTPNFMMVSGAIGVQKRIKSFGSLYVISNFSKGFTEIQDETIEIKSNGMKTSAELGSKHTYISFSVGYKIPIFTKRFILNNSKI